MLTVDCSIVLPRCETGKMVTRGHGFKLAKRECKRSQLRASFFGLRVMNLWKSLPAEIVDALSVNCLKGRFDRFG
jgi:hypothetical protein